MDRLDAASHFGERLAYWRVERLLSVLPFLGAHHRGVEPDLVQPLGQFENGPIARRLDEMDDLADRVLNPLRHRSASEQPLVLRGIRGRKRMEPSHRRSVFSNTMMTSPGSKPSSVLMASIAALSDRLSV